LINLFRKSTAVLLIVYLGVYWGILLTTATIVIVLSCLYYAHKITGKKRESDTESIKLQINIPDHKPPTPIKIEPESSYFIVPHLRNSLLRHEEAWINEIQRLLSEKGQAVISQSVALTGQGGVGKTAMAVEYAYRFSDKYPGGIYWLQMEQGMNSATRIFFELADKSGAEVEAWEDLNELELIRMLNAFLNQRPLKLVILDNLIENTLPKDLVLNDVHLLLTTRRRGIALPLIEMILPEEQEALDIFLAYANRKHTDLSAAEREAGDNICQRVDRLPLLILTQIYPPLARKSQVKLPT